jgi:SagB-type dehydrogenase family enzyme
VSESPGSTSIGELGRGAALGYAAIVPTTIAANSDTRAAWTYHDGTKHSLESIRREPHDLDWDNMPRPFKVYPELEAIPLAAELQSSSRPVLDVLSDARADRREEITIDRALLAHLLYFAGGVVRQRRTPIGDVFYRAAACTGNLHHIDLYAVCEELPDLAAGVYHFSPHDYALRRLRSGDHRGTLVDATAAQVDVVRAPVTIAFATTFWRNSWKYRARAYRHAFWDSGTLLANLLGVAAAREIDARVVLGFVDAELERLLDLDPDREAALGLLALGRSASPPPPAPATPRLALVTLPPSKREVDYPAIREAHAAGALTDAEEVRAWRRPLPSAEVTDVDEVIPLPAALPGPRESIEQVILRRGSTRRFSHEPVSLEALATILHATTQGVPADVLVEGAQRADLYVLVNAVTGLAPGAYFYARARHALVPLARGELRREAGFLGLGQDIPADAAFNVYWLTDLAPILATLGNRGYRTAQLEAAVGGGKTYLAAYALGLGASGLTFFDDDVTRFFSPHAAGKSVMFLMAVGVPVRRQSAG